MNLKFLRLPGSYNYKCDLNKSLRIKDIEHHLGPTLFSRLSNIYLNVIESIADRKYAYLSSSMSTSLSTHLISKRSELK